MAIEERDSTADWIVPAERRPPSAFELGRRIEVAAAVARAAEEAAIEIGQASLEAAEQARRAAAHAERSAEASVAAADAARAARASAGNGHVEPTSTRASAPVRPPDDAAPDGHEAIPGSELPVAWSPVAEPVVTRTKRTRRVPDTSTADPRLRAFIQRADRVDRRLRLILEGGGRTESAGGRIRDLRVESTAP